MYNEIQKKEYLETLKKNSEATALTFEYSLKQFAPVERMLKKDLCEFSFQDFVMLFNNNRLTNNSTFQTNKSNIMNYLRWCVGNGHAENIVLSELERLSLNDVSSNVKIKTEFYGSEDELLDCFDEVLSGEDKIYKYTFSVFYGLCWNGFSDEELFKTKAKSVIGNRIVLDDREVHLSERMTNILKEYLAAEDMIIGEQTCKFARSDLIIKCLDRNGSIGVISSNYHATKSKAWKRITEDLSIESRFYGKKIIPNKIRQSGAFYRLWQKEKSGVEVISKNIIELLGSDSRFVNKVGYITIRDYHLWKGEFAK